MSVPQEMQYSLKDPAVGARSYVSSLKPVNGAQFAMGTITQIDISCGRQGEFLFPASSYLRFKLTNTGVSNSNGNDTELDGGAHACISKLELYHGSSLIESISEYNALHAILNDLQTPYNNRIGVHDLIQGGATSETNSAQGAIEGGSALAENGGSKFFSFPLVSAFIGTLSDTAMPLAAMGSDLRIEITWANQNDAFFHPGSPVITVSDVSFEASIKQVDAATEAAVLGQAEGGLLSWHSFSFRNYTQSIGTNETQSTILVPARFSSLRNLTMSMRPAANMGKKTAYSIKGREKAGLTQYQLRVGNEMVPQQPIPVSNDYSVCVPELLRAYHMLASDQEHGLALTNETLWAVNDASADATRGSFVFGADLGSFEGKSSQLNAGRNTLSSQLFVELSKSATAHVIRFDAWAAHDMLCSLDLNSGQISVRF